MTDVPDRFEIFINEQRAELEMLKLIIQIGMIQLVDAFPPERRQAYLNDFENEVVGTLKTHSTSSSEPRFLEMMIARVERFFLAIRKAKGYPIQGRPEGQRQN